MDTVNTMTITQDLFQIIKHFSRVKWEQNPCLELKPSECEFLGILYINLSNGTEAITASALSSQLQITPAGVTHLINPLADADYIERLPDPNDRRVVLIGLTDKGKALAETVMAEAYERLAGLVDHLGAEDSRTLIRLMSATTEYLMAMPKK